MQVASHDEELLASLKSQYKRVRVLPDGSIAALFDLICTRAIVLGCERYGFAHRFCFKDKSLADRRFDELMSEDDELQGFVARR